MGCLHIIHVHRRHVRGKLANIHISRRYAWSRQAHFRDLATTGTVHTQLFLVVVVVLVFLLCILLVLLLLLMMLLVCMLLLSLWSHVMITHRLNLALCHSNTQGLGVYAY